MKDAYKKMRKGDEHLISLIYRPITEPIAKLLFKTSITPNQITTLGIIVALISGIFFSFGEYKYLLIGAILSQVTLILDLLDGQIARYKNIRTVFGRWYDQLANKIMKYLMLLGATIGAYKISNNPLILIIGAIAIFNIITISFISNIRLFYDKFRGYHELPKPKKFFIPFGMLSTTLITIAALFNKIDWLLWFFAVVGTLGWIKQIYSHYKLGNIKEKL